MKKDLIPLYFLSDKFDELLYNKSISPEERQSILESINFLERKITQKYDKENTITVRTEGKKSKIKPKKNYQKQLS